jgi:GntR family negative regulator for fad regulon and positive regulator of fabA
MHKRPFDHAEEQLIGQILDGTYPAGSKLPGERDLAQALSVTRPTLREVLRRLERDGWLLVQHGRATRVRDIWLHGGLNVLSAIVRYGQAIPPDFVTHLLRVRLALAPAFTRDAVDGNAATVVALLEHMPAPDAAPLDFAHFDWRLQHGLTVASGNPVHTLMLNGFAGIYHPMVELYFQPPEARQSSYRFYQALLDCARRGSGSDAERVTREIMQASIALWQKYQRRG